MFETCHSAGYKKKQITPCPSASKFSGSRQLCNLILCHLVFGLAKETGIDQFCRTFADWSAALGSMMCAMPCDSTAGLYRAF